MADDDPKTLVSTDWLAAHLNDPDLRVIDASYYLAEMGRDAKAEYDAGHIPGARFFDIDEIADARRASAYGRAAREIREPDACHGYRATATRWWSMTVWACFRRRACGGISG
jgi:3-mercaptopyruvate sulfurtransferase SseA